MAQIRTDMGTFGSAGDLGQVAQAAALTAEVTTALTGAGSQTETGAGSQTETAALADAPAGGTGATEGAYDTSGNRDTAILCINRNKVRIAEHRTILDAAVVRIAENRTPLDAAVVRIGELDTKQLKLVTRLKEVEDLLENFGIVAKN